MKYTYRTDTFADATGETLRAIYCAELGEMAVETKGDIICTEQDALEDVLAGTPWEGNDSVRFADTWDELDGDSISSAGLREWIDAKKQDK